MFCILLGVFHVGAKVPGVAGIRQQADVSRLERGGLMEISRDSSSPATAAIIVLFSQHQHKSQVVLKMPVIIVVHEFPRDNIAQGRS